MSDCSSRFESGRGHHEQDNAPSLVVPMRVPLVAIVLIVTPIPVGVAHQMPATSIIVSRMVFRLTPANVAILVACHTNTVATIHITAFISVRDRGRWVKNRRSRACNDSE